jgi:hypothetical protein
MKRLFTLLSLFVIFKTSLSAATYTAVASGNWATPSTWDLGVVPGQLAANLDVVIIPTGITVTTDVANQNPIGGGAFLISGLTIQTGGTLDYGYYVKFNAAANPFTIEAGGTLIFNSNLGNQATSGIFFGTETFNVASNVEIKNWNSATVPIGSTAMAGSTIFGNLTINHATLAGEWKQSGSTAGTAGTLFNVAGTLTFNNLNGKIFSFSDKNNSAFTSGTIGNLVVQNGCDVRGRGASGTAGASVGTTIVVNKNVIVSGTGSKLMFHDGGATSSGTLRIGGDLTISGTATIERGTGNAINATNSLLGSVIEFNGTVNQNVTIPLLSNLGTNSYNFRINNAGSVGNNTVSGGLFTFSNGWIVVIQGLVGTEPTYAAGSGVSYQLINASANYTAGSELPSTLTKLDYRNGTPVATTANLTINNTTLLTGDATTMAPPLTLPSQNTQILTLGANVILTLGSSTYNSFSPPAGGNGGFPTSFINMGASGSGVEIYMNSGTKNFGIGVGTIAMDYRKITLGINTSTYAAIKITTNTTGGGTSNIGFNTFTSSRRFKFEVTSGTLTNYTSLAFTVGASGQEGLASYPTANLRIAYSTTGQSGTYDVIPNAPWSGQSTTLAQTGMLLANFPNPGSITYFAYGADAPNDFTPTSGSWGDALSWSLGHIPTSLEAVTIGTGKTATLNGASPSPYTCAALSIAGTLTGVSGNTLNATGNITTNSGGVFNIPVGSQINMGANCGDNKVFTNNGTTNITGGTLVVNGQFTQSTATGAFNISAGEMINDPNGGSAANSLTSFTTTFSLSAGTMSLTGGTLTANDPNFVSFGSAFLFGINGNNTSAPNLTLKIGGTIGNSGATCPYNLTGSTAGMAISGSTNKLVVGTLIVEGPAATHYTSIDNTYLYVKNNITVPSGSELRILNNKTLGVASNLTIASGGILTSNGTILFEDLDGAFAPTSPAAAQTLTGNVADLRNFSSGATADLGSIKVNNINNVTLALDANATIGTGSGTALTLTNGKLLIGNNNLSVITGSSISGGTSASYVVTNGTGKLGQTGTGAKLYPVGTSTTSYDPVTITPTSSATFDVLVKTPITNAGTIVDITKVVQREWDITRTGTASATNLIFKPDVAALTVANTPPAALGKVGHWNNTAWDPFLSSAYSTATGWTLTGYTGLFSPFIVAAPDAVLAVELKKVTAYGKGRNNIIEWSTANEKNMKEYIVERSADGINAWEAISKQAAVNKDDSKYSVEDATASTLSFYRVKSVELGGKEDISKVVSVKRETKGKLNIARAYPNPSVEAVQIDFEATTNSKVTATLTDVLGKVVNTKQIEAIGGLNRLDLNLNAMAKGMYILTLQEGANVVTQRIVKQ